MNKELNVLKKIKEKENYFSIIMWIYPCLNNLNILQIAVLKHAEICTFLCPKKGPMILEVTRPPTLNL